MKRRIFIIIFFVLLVFLFILFSLNFFERVFKFSNKMTSYAVVNFSACNDSDGGINYYEKGIAMGTAVGPNPMEESCYLFETTGSGRPVNECEGSDPRCKVYEYWCEDDVLHAVEFHCANGCKNGACLHGSNTTYVTIYGKAWLNGQEISGKVIVVNNTFHKMGDVNWDGIIDSNDLTLLEMAYGSIPWDANWNSEADLNEDGRIDTRDVAICSRNFNKTATFYFTPFILTEKPGKYVFIASYKEMTQKKVMNITSEITIIKFNFTNITYFSCVSIGRLKAQCTVNVKNLNLPSSNKYFMYVGGSGKNTDKPAAGATTFSGSDEIVTVVILSLVPDVYQLGFWVFTGTNPDIIRPALRFWDEPPIEINITG